MAEEFPLFRRLDRYFCAFVLWLGGENGGWCRDTLINCWLRTYSGVSCLGSRDKPRLVSSLPKGTKIVDVAAGWNHSALVDSEGALFMWGAGKEGQTGLYSGADVSSPTRVDKLRKEKVRKEERVIPALHCRILFTEDWCHGFLLQWNER